MIASRFACGMIPAVCLMSTPPGPKQAGGFPVEESQNQTRTSCSRKSLDKLSRSSGGFTQMDRAVSTAGRPPDRRRVLVSHQRQHLSTDRCSG